MAVFNPYSDLIVPLGEGLQADPRFAGLNIFYDRTEEKVVPRENMPAINYFLETPWTDIARGSVGASLQTRRMYITIGIGVWCYDTESSAALDAQLFAISMDIADFLREHTEFNTTLGIFLRHDVPITFDMDYSTDDGGAVGTHRIGANFEIYSGLGR